jgi:hypothetical protein
MSDFAQMMERVRELEAENAALKDELAALKAPPADEGDDTPAADESPAQ